MSKCVRREDIFRCPVHKDVLKLAREQLAIMGAFSMKQIIETLGYSSPVAAVIRWDYVREILQHEQESDCELVSVVELYFEAPEGRDRRAAPLDMMPEKYLTIGHGKKTAGFASVRRSENATLAIRNLKQKHSVLAGVRAKLDQTLYGWRLYGSTPVREYIAANETLPRLGNDGGEPAPVA